MKDDYTPRVCIPLQAETLKDHPSEIPIFHGVISAVFMAVVFYVRDNYKNKVTTGRSTLARVGAVNLFYPAGTYQLERLNGI